MIRKNSGKHSLRSWKERWLMMIKCNPSSESVNTRDSIAKWHKAVERAKNWAD
ncbi:MAG: hypothetical protein P9L92_18340 [Candidatus Electryonea clarkiae]|nr:hypothetical protein [Candidatus Electryonea clarkiae]MDP8288491.1 hypothetical protein [Candidatus Electryonea clarkiae]